MGVVLPDDDEEMTSSLLLLSLHTASPRSAMWMVISPLSPSFRMCLVSSLSSRCSHVYYKSWVCQAARLSPSPSHHEPIRIIILIIICMPTLSIHLCGSLVWLAGRYLHHFIIHPVCHRYPSTYLSWHTYIHTWQTLKTNYHVEHHDFPNVGLFRIQQIRKMAPEFYDERELVSGNSGNPYDSIKKAFTHPEFYACMGVGGGGKGDMMMTEEEDEDDVVVKKEHKS